MLLDGIDARVGPDVEAVIACDEFVAQADYMPIVEHEHLVDDLVRLHAIGVMEEINLGSDGLRAAHAIAVSAERRIDAAESTLVRTAERRVDRRVGLARLKIAEALPIVRAVFFNG